MKKMILAASLLACIGSTTAMAQFSNHDGTPRGKAIVEIFGNFHSGFGAQNDDRGFDLNRAYLGYQYDLGKGLTLKAVMDMGAATDNNDRGAYIKNAMLTWQKGDLTLNGGLISTTQFSLQEKFWGYRYMYKSFQDEYKFGSSADLGISAAWQLNDWMSLDGIIVNGEGFTRIQAEDGLQYGMGATFTPIAGLSVRVYASLNEQTASGAKDVMNCATFVGYKADRFSIGAEYNRMYNYQGVNNHDMSGFSVYGTLKATDKTELFARYDNLFSKDDWAKSEEEGVLLLGAQWKLGKYVKLAPNFRMEMPKAKGVDNRYAGYLSCYFGL